MKHSTYHWVLTISVILLLSCGNSSNGPTQPADNLVIIRDNLFDPAVRQVSVGRIVVWRHEGANQHTVTSGSPASAGRIFESGILAPGGGYSFTFSQPGAYPYFCRIHGITMSGTIQVR